MLIAIFWFRFMFFTKWGASTPMVERAQLDGSERTALVDYKVRTYPTSIIISEQSKCPFKISKLIHLILRFKVFIPIKCCQIHWYLSNYSRWHFIAVRSLAKLMTLCAQVVYPYGVTCDFPSQHIYWVDAFLDFVERVNYDGSNRKTIKKGAPVSSTPTFL